MRRPQNLCSLVILVGTMALAQSNPVPLINNPLVPEAATPGGASFTLTVNGTGFVSNSVVNWNHTPLATTFVSKSQVTATVPASNIAAAGTDSVTITNPSPGGGTSNVDFFVVRQPFTAVSFGQTPVSTGTTPFNPVVADLNGDGYLDIVNLDETSFDTTSISVLLGTGNGTFQPHVDYPLPVPTLFNLVIGDFNNDGKLDIAASTDGIAILLGNGDGTFQPAQDFPLANYVGGLTAGDFNGDGNLDLAITIYYPFLQVMIVLGNGDGTFQAPVTYTVNSNEVISGQVITADFNGDGKLDLALPTINEVAIMLGNGDGTFQNPVNYTSAPETYNVLALDLNADGILDLAVQNRSSATAAISILLGNGDGTFRGHVDYRLPTIASLFSIAAGDLNGDGIPDLIGLSNHIAAFTFLGKGDGTFQNGNYFVATANADVLVGGAVGDFNGDGMIDIATASEGNNVISVLPQVTAVLSRTVVSFGIIKAGTTGSAKVTFSNLGSIALGIARITLTGTQASSFTETNTCGASLAAGANCTIKLLFKPKVSGRYSATVQIRDSALTVLQQVLLQGTAD
jgi:hypothetical protein